MIPSLDPVTIFLLYSKVFSNLLITASRFRQVLHTDPHQPSLSLLKSICYPQIHKFSTKATTWGCEHEKDGLLTYKTNQLPSHEALEISSCGFYISLDHSFLGASPDALVQCDCCGLGVVEVKCHCVLRSLPCKKL